jgi:hypothetical protein
VDWYWQLLQWTHILEFPAKFYLEKQPDNLVAETGVKKSEMSEKRI